jgi:hypothetical protein
VPMFLREFLHHSRASRSKSSLRHAVSYSSRAAGESSVSFQLDGIEKWIFSCLVHQPGILSLGWHAQNPVPNCLLVSPVFRYRSLDPHPRISIRNAVPSASFCSGKVPFLLPGR